MPDVPAWFAGIMFTTLATAGAGLIWGDQLGARLQRAGDVALLARTGELPAAGRDGACPTCQGRRCYSWKELGAPCERQKAPRLSATLWSTVGRHSPAAAYIRAVPARWSPLPLEVRVRLAPTWWAQRAGRPVRLGARVVSLP